MAITIPTPKYKIPDVILIGFIHLILITGDLQLYYEALNGLINKYRYHTGTHRLQIMY
ncbi:hypothetical protein XFLM_04685 [Xylella fastidiosa subsp. fastidiosa GB514]|uniref:Uncharacterized protein n=1 Tax=Xylella fastidiosa subsp. sandyi Ann-1 TaxID=155920 RepID=A0A060H5U6_XYLFS|nr:hypothetical protein XFLM_04685 [Xylella fastidiosa subsp. fastidiosa GB514]AIC10903.1 hypothetical protein D934_00390 [Xylella fastidiosa subsp. sandyi Ann-1]KAF0571409.1 hypothetical protein P305_04825 [Xylella fastidiosa subsp. fastidiosa Mus-1]SHG47628.1 hypothetical protein SAMN05660380_00770 [Xylella fastidiosa]